MNKKIYNSVFQKEIQDFIDLKRALGFSYKSEEASLRRIDTFLNANNLSEKCISKELCDLWCRKRTHETVTNQASRISIMRGFCKYLNDTGIPAYIPPKGITQKRIRYDAHIYTDEELKHFFNEVDKSQSVPGSCPYRGVLCQSFFGFYIPAVCVFQNCVLQEFMISTLQKDILLYMKQKIIKNDSFQSTLRFCLNVKN